ncbi:MAG: ATP-binding cassette domain-containing protein [Atopobiaceae bacterium]|jgi:putative ABC transport system ATP-binding protein|nr:ATP-binding cassette domain-containing protein [Atopobiaceae bacterium]MCI2173767.1 ATP-binding cassette domain-containing protein [Atopobiaceae bacterium]MCI2207591.1 ATP-binding cassette domain-containing protein [Atopobiaceae bacterium]
MTSQTSPTTSTDTMPTLQVLGLTKTFNPGTPVEHHALNGIDVTLMPGEFACVVGSNGAGKSTMFNAIAGSIIPDGGLVRIAGENVTFKPDFKRARTLSRVFQDPLKGTAPNLTVAENVALAYGRSTKSSLAFAMRRERREMIHDRLASLGFGLEERMDTKVGTLSGGQRQAVTLLMATIGNPSLLLLDEHTAALDPEATRRILDLTDKIVSAGRITTMMITHNLGDALSMGDRTLVMDDGRIVADVSADERRGMGVDDLLALFRANAGHDLDDDKVLLEK